MNEEQIGRFSRNRILQELVKRNLSIKGDFEILQARLIQNNRRNDRRLVRQSFDFLAVIDFEATCVQNPPRPPDVYLQEIIEFPIVLIDVAQETIIDKFHSYCRPVHTPILSDYCKKLTGITQEQINHAPPFSVVFDNVQKWLNDRNLFNNSGRRCIFVTDSRSDLNKYLYMQCEISQIPFPEWANQWINIKSTFKQFYFIESGRIHNMLDKLDLPFIGNLHSGLDDATNIATIVLALIKDGCLLTSNEYFLTSMTILMKNTRVSTISLNSSRMICLNCSQCHAEIQDSCIQSSTNRRQKSISRHFQTSSNQ